MIYLSIYFELSINFSQSFLHSIRFTVHHHFLENPLGLGSIIWIDILQEIFNFKYPNDYKISLGS